jgi:hypothetical protein
MDRTRIDSIDPVEVHTQWLCIIVSTFGSDVKIINNNNKPVIHVITNATKEKGMSHEHKFKLYQKPVGVTANPSGTPKTAFTSVLRILIRVPYGQIKRHPPAFQLLKEHNCFLREHMWDEQARMGHPANRICHRFQPKVLYPRESYYKLPSPPLYGHATSKSPKV